MDGPMIVMRVGKLFQEIRFVDARDVFDTRERFGDFFCRIETADSAYLTLMWLCNLEDRMEEAGVVCSAKMKATIKKLLDKDERLYVDVGDWS